MSDDAPVEHALGNYRIALASAFGPRITGLTVDGEGDLLARPPQAAFHGGHRLWAAPEIPEITYAPDDQPCTLSLETGRVTATGPPDGAGFSKRISVGLDGASLLVEHELTNATATPRRVAPWAVTQLKLGGTALLPVGSRDDTGDLQADRSVVLWPYTRLNDPRLVWLDGGVAVTATPGGKLKVGSGPHPARLGYYKDGFVFVKEVGAVDGPWPDRGAVGQVFTNEVFCEVESVGALMTLGPGETATHRERWRLLPCPDLDAARQELGL
ncbi:MAG TPA: hypothetical protein VJ938_05820 [Acidimicrobiia bacterium]|nr:hypothetical protein [Acidimicrobiia bacterium]